MKILNILSHLLAVSGGLAAPSLSPQPAIRIPLTRTVLDAQNASLPHDGVNEFSKRGGAAVGLHGLRDPVGWIFTGPLKIRNTEFQCLFDTGSHKVLVAGKGCNKNKGCGAGPRYDNGGKHLSKDGRVDYLMGGAQGQLWSDDISIGGKKAKDQEILVMETMKDIPDSLLSICGMALDRGDVSGSRTFFSNMMAQGSAGKDEFSFQLGRGDCSELMLGGRDEAKIKGSLTTIPVTKDVLQRYRKKQQTSWEVQLGGININGKALKKGHFPIKSLVDTGVTSIVVPKAVAELIARALGGSTTKQEKGFYDLNLPCNLDKSVDLILGGRSFPIRPSELLRANSPPAGSKQCLSTILGHDKKDALLGFPLLVGCYAVFSDSADNGSPAILLGDSNRSC